MRKETIRLARRLELFYLARRLKLTVYRRLPRSLRDDAVSLDFYSQFVGPGDLVFDVGANVGIKTKTFLGLSAEVVCVEPQEEALRELRAVFGRRRDVVIVAKALAGREGVGELHLHAEQSGLSTMSGRWRREGRHASDREWGEPQQVETTTLDALIARYGVPAYCKIDVEGFEASVLAGLTRPIPLVSFEFHAELLDEARACVDRLRQLGGFEFNCTVGKGTRMWFPEWTDGGRLLEALESAGDPSLQGEIYARAADPAPAREPG